MSEFGHTILCVDDEVNILHALNRVFRKEGYRILTASDGPRALGLLEENKDVHLVISDQRMPGMTGTDFLAIVREKYPEIIRIVLTGYTEVDAITDSINKGHIYKFILKPWNDQNLVLDVRQCLEQFELREANIRLHNMILKQNEELKRINENLEFMVKERTEELEIQNRVLELSRAILEDLPWPVIGISNEMIIALINTGVQALTDIDKKIEVGKRISDCFPPNIEDIVRMVINTTSHRELKAFSLGGHSYNISFIPSSGIFKGKGAVMALTPA